MIFTLFTESLRVPARDLNQCYLITEAALKKRMQKLQKKSEEEEDDEDEMEAEDEEGIVLPKINKNKKKTERDIELEQGDDYGLDFNKRFLLENPTEKYDVIPEHWHGHNIADYIDPDIMKKLDELEKEEELRDKSGFYDIDSESEDENMKEIRSLAGKIRIKKKLMKNDQRIDNSKNKPVMPRTTEPAKRSRSVSRLKKEFTELGVDMTGTKFQGKSVLQNLKTLCRLFNFFLKLLGMPELSC